MGFQTYFVEYEDCQMKFDHRRIKTNVCVCCDNEREKYTKYKNYSVKYTKILYVGNRLVTSKSTRIIKTENWKYDLYIN